MGRTKRNGPKGKKSKDKELDNRYDTVATMYRFGEIHSLQDILKYIPKTVVANGIEKRVSQFNRLLKRPGDFILKDIYTLGHQLGLSEREIYIIIETYYFDIRKERIEQSKK